MFLILEGRKDETHFLNEFLLLLESVVLFKEMLTHKHTIYNFVVVFW